MIKTFFNERAARWDETAAEKDASKLENMADRLTLAPGAAVLDVGTGTGILVPYILHRIGRYGKLVCLDVAEEMLKRCRAKNFPGDIEYLCADIGDAPLEGQTFDAVICYSSFPHFQDKAKALGEINRVLKTRGRLYICHTAGRGRINAFHSRIPEVCHDQIPDEKEMRTLLQSAGFTEISLHDEADCYLAGAEKM